MNSEIEVLLDVRAELGEGPVWDGRQGRLIWLDILAGDLHRTDPVTREDEVVNVGQPVGAAALRAAGGLVLAMRDGFALLDSGGEPRLVAEVEADNPANRMNDGACDRAGRFWAGTMAFDPKPGAGTLYRLDPDLTVTPMVEGVTISNGIGWSLDDRTMYYIDSPTLGVDAFDYDLATGAIERRRRLATIPDGLGDPDGLVVDSEGFIWVALFGGGRLHRYSPRGELERSVGLPASQPTKPAFGGPDYSELYVTSAWEGLGEQERDAEPAAGALMRLRPGVRGLPANEFRG
jgi:sugar lactone lactonase YvrE